MLFELLFAMGWYDYSCCADLHCRRAVAGEIQILPDGWYVTTTKDFLSFDDPRVKMSQDDNFHPCIRAQTEDLSLRPILVCLYVPGGET